MEASPTYLSGLSSALYSDSDLLLLMETERRITAGSIWRQSVISFVSKIDNGHCNNWDSKAFLVTTAHCHFNPHEAR